MSPPATLPGVDEGRRTGVSLLLAVGTVLLALPATRAPGVTEAACVLFLMAAALQPARLGRGAWAPLGMACLAGASATYSVDAGQSVFTTLLWLGGAGVVLATREDDVPAVQGALVVVLCVVAMLAAGQVLGGLDAARDMAAASHHSEASRSFVALWAARGRPIGPFSSPDVLAGFLLPTFALVVPRPGPGPRGARVVGLAAAALGGLTLLGTQSVGAAVSLAVGMGVAASVAWWRENPRRVMATWVGGVLLVAVLAWIREGTQATQASASASHRVEDWLNALHVFQAAPPWGVGAGAFESAFNAFSPPGRRYAAFAHGALPQVLVELGLPGLVMAVAAYTSVAWQAVVHARRGGIQAWQAGGVLAAVVHHQLDYDLHVSGGLGLWLGCSVLFAGRAGGTAWPVLRLGCGMAAVAGAWLCTGAALAERGVPRLDGDRPDVVSTGRGLALIGFDARARVGAAEDLWLHARWVEQQGADASPAWLQMERQASLAAEHAPLLPAGPMLLARSRAQRGELAAALEAYGDAAARSCCSRAIRQERALLARALGRAELAAADEAWLAEHPPR